MRHCAFGPFQGGHLFGRFFKKISLGPPFALFQKMRTLGELAKIAITWCFGYFCSRCLRQKHFHSLHVKCVLIRGKGHLRDTTYGFFKRGLPFGRFLKNFPWSPVCTFSENAGFGGPCKNCHNLAIRVLLEPLFALKFCPIFAL